MDSPIIFQWAVRCVQGRPHPLGTLGGGGGKPNKTANQSFGMTLGLLRLYHHAKLGYKKLNFFFFLKGSAVQRICPGRTIIQILNLRCDLHLEHTAIQSIHGTFWIVMVQHQS